MNMINDARLRQALEALSRAHQTAMEQTLKARIPECAEFAGIAQDLDFVAAALEAALVDAERYRLLRKGAVDAAMQRAGDGAKP